MDDKKKQYNRPEADVVNFSKEDVINTSLGNAGVAGEIGDDGEQFGGN